MSLHLRGARRALGPAGIAWLACACWLGPAGCAAPERPAAARAAPTIADRVQAIRDDPTLSPTDRAIAVQRLEQSMVQGIMAGRGLSPGR